MSALAGKDVPFVPTPPAVVEGMLKAAEVGPNDLVIDLGSGDGRIAIMAAEKFGARAVGIELDPALLKESRENAKRAGVADRVEFREQDLFDADLSGATVLTMYLLPSVNLKLRDKILRDMKPGARVVSHDFAMGDWPPSKTMEIGSSTVHLWIVPERAPRDRSARVERGARPHGG